MQQKVDVAPSVLSQVYLLAAPASTSSLIVFRTHLGLLNGALLALLFPVTDAYSLPGEVHRITMEITFVQIENTNAGNSDICPQYSLYWIQHVAMLLVPFLLNAQVLKRQ